MRPSELDETQWRRLLEGLALSEYSLVLGGGASIGALDGAGEPLPSGEGLREKLLEHYKFPDGQNQSLRQIYDLAQIVSRRNNTIPLKNLIAPWFSDCTVSEWYGNLVATPWRVIWNRNIDDVLANAYQRTFREKARQELRVMSWRGKWMASRDRLDKVQAVHIHGDARKASRFQKDRCGLLTIRLKGRFRSLLTAPGSCPNYLNRKAGA